MDILERIIENLTSDEVRRFKILSNRFKADEEKKLLVLFDAIRGGDFKEVERDVVTQFYGSTDARAKNSYYRLRNKLLSNLEKSLLFYHFNYKNSIEAHSNLQLAILCRERVLYRESFYYLRKAEKVAIEYDQFSLLEVIYDEMVQLAVHHDVEIEAVIERRKENLKKIEILRANSEVLGVVTHQLRKRNFARRKRNESVLESLEQIKARLEEHKDIFHSLSGRTMILKTVSTILVQKSAYGELEKYLKSTFEEFESENLFNKETHATRLLMRILRINALHKLLRIDAAKEEIDAFHQELKMFKKQNFKEFAFHFYLSRVYNLKLSSELDTAGKYLKEAFEHKEILLNESNHIYLMISQADQFFSEAKYLEALATIKEICTHRFFQRMDEEIRFYIHIFEMVNFFEAKQQKKVESAYKALRKKYKNLWKDDFYAKARRFVDLIIRMSKAEVEGKKVFLKSALRNFLDDFSRSEIGSNQVILYEVYLYSRLNPEKKYYDLLCEEVKKRSR